MNLTRFYERYWQRPEVTESHDPGLEIEPRKKLLHIALKDIPRSAPVLDAGCCSGTFAAFLHQLGYTVFGIDISLNASVSVTHSFL